MANIIATRTVGTLKLLEVDTNPKSGGIIAPIGTFCLALDGSGFFYKTGIGNTQWDQGGGFVTLTTIGSSGVATYDPVTQILNIPNYSLGSDKNFLYTQSIASKTWTIIHNLSKFPSITIVDTANTEIEGFIQFIDINTAVVTFSAPFSGYAYCN